MAAESTERKILAVLEQDAKASYGEIADRVGVSKPTVRKYVRKLEEEGIIVGYTAEINPKKITGETIALVGIEAESERYVEVANSLKALGSVDALYTSSGDHMFMADIRGRDGDHVGQIIQQDIMTIEGVTAAHPSFLQERLK